MVKKTRWLACLLTILGILLSSSPVSAAAANTGSTSTGFTIWPSKTTTEVNKVWTISFDNPLLSSSVNSSTIYVTDSKQKKFATTAKLSDDGLSVRVSPSSVYTAGDYNLYITSGVTSVTGAKLSGTIIVPFTVTPLIGSTLVVTVNYDIKPSSPSDLSGSLTLIDPNGSAEGPSSNDYMNGKYTFNIYANGDYLLNYYSVSNGILTTRSIKIPKITLPTSGASLVKTTSLTFPTEAGIASSKSGTIGGSVTPETFGLSVEISNTTTTWTTTTDADGKFSVNLPTGSYTLSVDGKDNSLYKKHSYKLTVTGGQMASPLDMINVEEPIN
ncbi:Ig-like domain-containing protein [Desulfosporosinus sp. SB140]|uniref:Ig-like domain-containing protein n=1 Tax=Desulfosporosinus paludis TaxID=3115649 RepID=UPI00388EFEAF